MWQTWNNIPEWMTWLSAGWKWSPGHTQGLQRRMESPPSRQQRDNCGQQWYWGVSSSPPKRQKYETSHNNTLCEEEKKQHCSNGGKLGGEPMFTSMSTWRRKTPTSLVRHAFWGNKTGFNQHGHLTVKYSKNWMDHLRRPKCWPSKTLNNWTSIRDDNLRKTEGNFDTCDI